MGEQKRIRVSQGRKCKDCGLPTIRFAHPSDWKPDPGQGYFRVWDVCNCGRIQNYQEYYVPAAVWLTLKADAANFPAFKPNVDRMIKDALNKSHKRQEQKEKTKAKKAAKTARRSSVKKAVHTPTAVVKAEFYASWEWTTLRMKTLQRYGRRCMCCGATPADGIVLNVDHIKPLSKFWELRLDPENLQVLCHPCNKGKGAWDQTDYRAA